MKIVNKFTLLILIFFTVSTIIFTACDPNTEPGTKTISDDLAVVSTEMVLPVPDTKETVKNLLGKWIDINYDSRFINITETETGYQYEDNEGIYAATFKDGVLKVKVSDTDTAQVYFNKDSGELFSVYQTQSSVYKKK